MLWGEEYSSEGGRVKGEDEGEEGYGIGNTMDGEKGEKEIGVRDVMFASSRRDRNALTDRESSRQLRVAGFTVDVVEGCPLHRIMTKKRVKSSGKLTHLYRQLRASND